MKQLNKIYNFKRQRGSALTEALLYMGVVALLVGTAYGAYRVVNSDIAIDKEIKATTGLISKVRQVYGPAGDYTGATAANIILGGLVPPDFAAQSATVIVDSFKYPIDFTTATTSLTMKFNSLTPEACSAFGAGVQGLSFTLMAGTQTVKDATTVYSPAALAAGCQTAGSSNTLTITIR